MIGVCVNFIHTNYGTTLQAYATAAALEAENVEYELIRYKKKRTVVEKICSVPRLLNGVLLNDKYEAIVKKIGEIQHPAFAEMDAVRKAEFDEFQNEHFTKLSPVFVGYNALCEGANRYSAVVTGSDQLWSPAGLPTNYYNLMFVPDSIRKISFASSFGVSNIPWYQMKRTREYLNRIQHISMRENRGAEIVKELTGRTVPVVMDPVFYFDKQEWEALIPPAAPEWENYIFCYFLGANPEHREAAKKLAAQTGKKIVTLRHLDRYVAGDEDFGDYAPYDVDPARFLSILRNADYICTDSFHGSAFSILHEKKFVVFDRYNSRSANSKNSRIDSLCRNLGLEDRRYSGQPDILQLMEQEIDYAAVVEKTAQYRVNMKDYLSQALGKG